MYRLKGHKGGITQVSFLKEKNVVVSSSKDTFVKFWDLDTQHCFKTLVGHRSEVHDFVVVRNGHRLITGSVDSELRVWNIQYIDEMEHEKTDDSMEPKTKRARVENLTEDDEEEETEEDLNILQCTKVGSVMRQGRDRVVSMATDSAEKVLACHGNESSLELFRLPTDDELKKHMLKRKKKLKKKLLESSGEQDSKQEVQITLKDEVQKLNTVKMSSKIVAVDLVDEGTDDVKKNGEDLQPVPTAEHQTFDAKT